MNPLDIIKKYYIENSDIYNILVNHSTSVTQKALLIAENKPHLNIDTAFIYEAGMLHDIGIYLTNAPSISCEGEMPYIAHGYLGSDILKKEGFPKHALVCERHTGTGLSKDEIITQQLPIPHRDMLPLSIDEQVICFADCFFSKTHLDVVKSPERILNNLEKFGQRSADQFKEWCNIFL